jgi:hypothetical protein
MEMGVACFKLLFDTVSEKNKSPQHRVVNVNIAPKWFTLKMHLQTSVRHRVCDARVES